MIKAVIFDLDGLLIDSEIISYEIYKALLAPFGINFSISDYAENYSGKSEIKNVAYLIQSYGLPWSSEVGLKKVTMMEESLLAQGVDLKPGAKRLLMYLKEKDYKIALASSSVEKRALDILDKHEIKMYFDAFVFGHEVERGKPYPDIFLKACAKIKVSPKECLVLEDSEAGVEAAHAAGIPVICIPDMKKPQLTYLEMTLMQLESLDEVITYLKEIQ